MALCPPLRSVSPSVSVSRGLGPGLRPEVDGPRSPDRRVVHGTIHLRNKQTKRVTILRKVPVVQVRVHSYLNLTGFLSSDVRVDQTHRGRVPLVLPEAGVSEVVESYRLQRNGPLS